MGKSIRAAVIAAPGKVEIQRVEVPSPGEHELLVKLIGCGVCASNIPPWEGREWFSYPLEPGGLGHEGWGVVEAVGSNVSDFRAGDKVAFLGQHSYAEYDLVDASSAIKVPEELGDMGFPGEPLGCAMNIFSRSRVKAGDTVAIVGIGFLGTLLVQLCVSAGARVIALDRKQSSLDVAKEAGAAETVLMDDHWRVIEQVKHLTDGTFCDVVIEATGKQWPLDLAAELCKEMGHLVIAGYHQDGLRQVNMQLWNWRGLDVTNAHEREPQKYIDGMSAAARACVEGRIKPSPLFTHSFPLDRLGEALDMTKDRPIGFMKAVIYMEGSAHEDPDHR